MGSKTVLSFFVLFVCSLQSGSSNVIPHLTVNFEQNLNDAMARENHVIELFRDIKDKAVEMLKEPYKSITYDTITEFVNELQQHYDELKQESSRSETIPNMEHNLIEAKIAEIAPKYIDNYTKQILAAFNANPTIPNKSKIVINRETNFIVKKINGIIIPSLLSEVKNNPKDWIVANPIEAYFLHTRGNSLSEERRESFKKIGERFKTTAMTLQIAVAPHVEKLGEELGDYISVFTGRPESAEETASSEIVDESE